MSMPIQHQHEWHYAGAPERGLLLWETPVTCPCGASGSLKTFEKPEIDEQDRSAVGHPAVIAKAKAYCGPSVDEMAAALREIPWSEREEFVMRLEQKSGFCWSCGQDKAPDEYCQCRNDE
jgi:hypothetical protein